MIKLIVQINTPNITSLKTRRLFRIPVKHKCIWIFRRHYWTILFKSTCYMMKEQQNNCWNLQCFGYTSEYVVKVKWRQLQLRKDLWIQFGNLKEYGKYVDELQNNMNKLLTTTIPNWTEAKGHVYDNTILNNRNKINNEYIYIFCWCMKGEGCNHGPYKVKRPPD